LYIIPGGANLFSEEILSHFELNLLMVW